MRQLFEYHMQASQLDKVKIGHSFLENIDDADAAKVVKALAGLGRGLGLAVSAVISAVSVSVSVSVARRCCLSRGSRRRNRPGGW